jgi:hypothetical protein
VNVLQESNCPEAFVTTAIDIFKKPPYLRLSGANCGLFICASLRRGRHAPPASALYPVQPQQFASNTVAPPKPSLPG